MDPLLLGIDVGTSSVKAVLLDLRGNLCAVRQVIREALAVLLQLRNYATGEWSQALCSACGVEPAQFPEVLEGHRVQGEVTVEAAQATGLRAGTPVMAGTVDSAAGAFPDVRKSLLEMIRLDRRFEPNQANHERYTRIYQVFRDIYRHLKDDFGGACFSLPSYLPKSGSLSLRRAPPVNLFQKLDGPLNLGRGLLLRPPENRRHDGGQFFQQRPVHLSQQAH